MGSNHFRVLSSREGERESVGQFRGLPFLHQIISFIAVIISFGGSIGHIRAGRGWEANVGVERYRLLLIALLSL